MFRIQPLLCSVISRVVLMRETDSIVLFLLGEAWLKWSMFRWTFYICGYCCCNIDTVMARNIETKMRTNWWQCIFDKWMLTHSFFVFDLVIWLKETVSGRLTSVVQAHLFSVEVLMPSVNQNCCQTMLNAQSNMGQWQFALNKHHVFVICFLDLGNCDGIPYIETRWH